MRELKTGIPDLDLILGGGLELGSVVILAGAPGTGKTILAQQIAFTNATPERKAMYYSTLAEPHTKLVRHLEPFKFYDPTALGIRVDFIHLGDLVREKSDNGLPAAIEELNRATREEDPAVIVVDSAKALRDFIAEDQLRTVFYQLAAQASHKDAVLLLLGEYTANEMEGSAEFSLADTIIELAFEARQPLDQRWLRVRKRRGASSLGGKHSFQIHSDGIEVFPRLETLTVVRDGVDGSKINSGVSGMDAIMGGGMSSGDSTVVLGPSGAGKTIVGLSFLQRGLEEGERGLYVSFQETKTELLLKAGHFGWGFESAIESDQLVIHHVPVGTLDLDVLAAAVRRELDRKPIQRVVVDSLAELVFAARESERFPAFARALVGLIQSHRASVMITSETTTLGPMTDPTGGLSFLFSNVILLRYIETDARVLRAVNIIKMRNSDHDKGTFAVEIDERGMHVEDRLAHVTGILGWSALRSQG